ncbi:MAG TPA: HlyD family secretion protein [Deltaproteobacteria bacterium]|nr:HlyD family secretion protein [Deltaproteobacteria bacterium]
MSTRRLSMVFIGLLVGVLTLSAIVRFGWFPGRAVQSALLVSGNIEAHESVLGFKTVQSRLVELPFDEGQWVDAGTVLARLDDSDYRQEVAVDRSALAVQERQLEAAEENLEAAKKIVAIDQADLAQKSIDFERARNLWETKVASAQTRDLAHTALKQSTAMLQRDQALLGVAEKNLAVARSSVENGRDRLKLAEINLGYTVLTAPFAGVILVRQAELGEVMLPGTPVVTLADLDHVWLRAYINEKDIAKIRFGQRAVIRTDTYPDKRYEGRISFISSQAEFTPKSVETHAERVTLVYRIKIDVDNSGGHDLKPGMPADASIELKPSSASN